MQVKGTNDIRRISGGGNWVSRDTYSKLDQTLQLLNENMTLIKECSYNAQGQLVTTPPPPCVAEWYSFNLEDNAQAGCTVKWELTNQSGYQNYSVRRRDAGTEEYTEVSRVAINNNRSLETDLFVYSYDDDNLNPGTYEYLVVAVDGGCTENSVDSPLSYFKG